MRPLTAQDIDGMGWSGMHTRIRTWRLLVREYGRFHHDRYHVTKRTRRPQCSCPFGVA